MTSPTWMDPYSFDTSKGGAHPSPYFTYSQVYSPKRLKELFKWSEFLFYNSAQIYAALRKFGEYPISDFNYITTNQALKSKHKFLIENVIRGRELLIKSTLDKYVYGNCFLSMYQPFIRYLKCPKCGVMTNIQNIRYKFNVKNLSFAYKCAACKQPVVASEKHIEDRKVLLSKRINFIRWDPKLMDIDHDRYTGDSVYYYTIPREDIQRVNNGHKTLIDSMPIEFLKAIKDEKQFRFAPDAIFHMKVGGPAGISPQWGLPPLISALNLFHYAQILRKANEAIALDYLVPLRVLHPAQSSNNADPLTTISLERWMTEMQSNVKAQRKDPLHMMFAPIPVGVTQIGGNGRALLTLGEQQEAEKNIIAALGIPMEFIYGGLTKGGMEATLKLIENQLQSHINDLKDLLQWVDDSCAKFLGWERIRVDMADFTMVDDDSKKQMVMQLFMAGEQQGAPIISKTTVAELNGIDLRQEKERIKQETLDALREQAQMQKEITKIQNNVADQVQQQAQVGPQQYNQQQIIAQADQVVQQITQMDPSMRKSQLHALETEDYVLYSVVIQRLEQMQTGSNMASRSSGGGMGA